MINRLAPKLTPHEVEEIKEINALRRLVAGPNEEQTYICEDCGGDGFCTCYQGDK